jgi:very-short-patch-repair endonuclease
MNKIFNKTEYTARRQTLRNNMTEPEKRLWQILRNQQMGVKFRRQHGIGHYIVDFYCPERKLVIEVDGDSHYTDDAQHYDTVRADFMLALGITTMRFTNHDVMTNLNHIYQQIAQQLTCMDTIK